MQRQRRPCRRSFTSTTPALHRRKTITLCNRLRTPLCHRKSTIHRNRTTRTASRAVGTIRTTWADQNCQIIQREAPTRWRIRTEWMIAAMMRTKLITMPWRRREKRCTKRTRRIETAPTRTAASELNGKWFDCAFDYNFILIHQGCVQGSQRESRPPRQIGSICQRVRAAFQEGKNLIRISTWERWQETLIEVSLKTSQTHRVGLCGCVSHITNRSPASSLFIPSRQIAFVWLITGPPKFYFQFSLTLFSKTSRQVKKFTHICTFL